LPTRAPPPELGVQVIRSISVYTDDESAEGIKGERCEP